MSECMQRYGHAKYADEPFVPLEDGDYVLFADVEKRIAELQESNVAAVSAAVEGKDRAITQLQARLAAMEDRAHQ